MAGDGESLKEYRVAGPARAFAHAWRRIRRGRRAGVVAALVAVTVVLSGSALLVIGPAPAQGRPAVPSRVYPPFTGQSTINEDPPGPAAIVVAGDQELRGSDIWGWEGRSLVVGRDGRYRLARTVGESAAGSDGLLLSPDGRHLASLPWLEGSEWPEDPVGRTAVADLTTGSVRLYAGGLPLAWTPDGRSLLVRAETMDGQLGQLSLLDLATGTTRRLPAVTGGFRPGNVVAFAPGGTRMALATGTALHVVDPNAGAVRKIADLTSRDRLAGPGAWLPDGRRIALWSVADCDGRCDEDRLARREIRIRYLDPESGASTSGPALPPAHGLAARLLGWQRDGDAVVAEYAPEAGLVEPPDEDLRWETDWWSVGGVELAEFRPDGPRRELVELPESALFVDVPADLLDHFGGPAPSRLEGTVRWLLALYWPLGQIVVALVGLVALRVGLRWMRRRGGRRKAWTRETAVGPRST